MAGDQHRGAERDRLIEDELRKKNWKRWGPYLSERQWGTVREDYSPDGSSWTYFPHDQARSRAYRWGEDGLLGIADRECRLCFALALWNGRDPFLKERLFGLANPEGNHGEDVKEAFFYLDSTPTHSYMKALYKYPHMSRMEWFIENRKDLAGQISCMSLREGDGERKLRLLAIPSRARLERVLGYLLDEKEFLSPHGIRSLSLHHRDHPYRVDIDGRVVEVGYEPGDSRNDSFGGNSNWRGPVWLPINYLIIEALERYHRYYRDTLLVECPTGSGRKMDLCQVADEIKLRLLRIFLPAEAGGRPAWQGEDRRFQEDPHWRGLHLFHEFFHGDTGRGLGASHQTGWTALVARLLEDLGRIEARRPR